MQSGSSESGARAEPWRNEEITFPSGPNDLFGVLALPQGPGPFPALALMSGSVDPETGVRGGAADAVHRQHACRFAEEGFAVLRYDPPGVGRSEGQAGFESLEDRTAEALAAVDYLRSRPDIRPDRVGLWGISQGGWVIGMAAAAAPEKVAFIISVSGAGISVVEQQLYAVETQTRASGVSEDDVARALLFWRLLIDWQLAEPKFRAINEAEAERLGPGPWREFAQLVYEPGGLSPPDALARGIAILEGIQDQFWAQALYLKTLYLPRLRSVPPDRVAAGRTTAEESLFTDPADFLPRVHCPVLALFGETDRLVPAARSAALFRQYLSEAGNADVEIVVFPGWGHALDMRSEKCWGTLADWLAKRAP